MKNWVYKLIVLFIILSLSFSLSADNWFGKDKVFHFFTSCIITVVVAGPLNYYTHDKTKTMGYATSISLTIGILKEFKDMKKGNREDFSYKDLIYDTAGTFVGMHLMQKGVLCEY